jgi:hypothetical protein
MTRLFHRRYANPATDTIEEWAALRADLLALDVRVSNMAKDPVPSILPLKPCVDRLSSQLAANICMTSIILGDLADTVIRPVAQRLRNQVKNMGMYASYYLISLDICHRAATGDQTLKRREISNHFAESEIRRHLVLPYDRQRYNEIAERATKP